MIAGDTEPIYRFDKDEVDEDGNVIPGDSDTESPGDDNPELL
jgi:hypothetical protein